jgi:LuxR family transcriptional regulator, maltose regulon positive regulatory protein
MVTEAWLAAFSGNEALLASRLEASESVEDSGPLADGSRSVASATAMIRGLFGYGGPLDMRRASLCAVELETDPTSPFYSVARAALGHAHYVLGELDAAVAPLEEAAGNARAPVIIRAFALAARSMIAHEQANLSVSRDYAQQAVTLLEEEGPRAVPQASLAYAAKAQVQASSGQVQEALADLGRALDVRRKVFTGPWGMIHHLHVHARVAAEAGETELAVDLLAELSTRLDRYDEGLDAMRARVAAVRRMAGSQQPVVADVDALTQREISMLRLLRGPMTTQEIAAEMRLSSNTVKTHVRSVYRKLGAHTRTDAVTEGRRRGMI